MIIIHVAKYDSSKEIDQTKIFFLNNYKQIEEDKWGQAFDLGTEPYPLLDLFDYAQSLP